MKKKATIFGALMLMLLVGGTIGVWTASAGLFAKSHRAKPDERLGQATPESRFVTLDKLIVMLREPAGSRSRYLVMDLVFQTDESRMTQVRDQLPLLRSTAYRALSGYSADDIRRMEVDQLAATLQQAYAKVYGQAGAAPFSSVQISRQMLE